MIKIATLTLNPAVDRTMYFPSPFEPGGLNRAVRTVTIPGGKGMNVSRVIELLAGGKSRDGEKDRKEAESISYLLVGGDEGRAVSRFLDVEKLTYRAVETSARSRVNIKLIDSSGVCTEANEAGGPVNHDEIQQLFHKLSADAESGLFDILVCGGSIPQGVDKSVYKSIIGKIKGNNVITVLDCDGSALRLAMQDKSSAPSLIKPNLFELSQFCGKDFSHIERDGVSKNGLSKLDEIKKACVEIFSDKSTAVICTMGAAGTVYTGAEGNFYTSSPSGIQVRGFAGAGDTFLASFLWKKYVEKCKIEDCLRFASSGAAAKVECEGASLPDSAEEMLKYYNDVCVLPI